MIGRIGNLAIWEWFKLRRRWMLWILLAFAILFAQLAVWGSFFSYQNLRTTGGEITVPATLQSQQGRAPRTLACNDLLSGDPARQPTDLDVQVLDGMRAQCRQQLATQPQRLQRAYENLTLPGSIPLALGTLQTLGLILIAVLTASAIGIDYGAGTLRSVLVQGTGRWPYLAAKLLVLVVLAGLGLIVATVSVVISSALAERLATPAAASSAAWSAAGIAVWKAWLSLIPYITLTTFVTVLARSSAAGMAIGLGYYFAEQILVALLSNFFSWFANVAEYLPVHSISAWSGSTGFGGPAAPADLAHAGFVLVGYTLVLGGLAFWLFQRRDVQGATGGG
ncbi:MAG TPA: ABC transporter permease subunit [Patescibacteria group bacterium]|nr:ABC transporter permease subunit [Patescibacteria group bacterium]